MKKIWTSALLLLSLSINASAQGQEQNEDSSWKKTYRSFATKENDLVHTKLVANFNYEAAQLNGEAWLQLHPHFYATDQLVLDAKGMEIKEVALFENNKNKQLKYKYDGLLLTINLDKKYTAKENYTIYIKYIAKPNDYKTKGSAAITDAKGLYFINPKGTESGKPTQIWTRGKRKVPVFGCPLLTNPIKNQHKNFI